MLTFAAIIIVAAIAYVLGHYHGYIWGYAVGSFEADE